VTRRERYLGFLARSYARMMDRLAATSQALVEQPGGADPKTLARLWRAGERLAESFTRLVELSPEQRHPHRKSRKAR
jgi:hypothetical protein